MAETPAAELREAAKLMRERAQAATPGPWSVRTVPARWSGFDRMPEAYIVMSGSLNVANVNTSGTAAHAAGMHPGVALAVADWLDETAADRHPSLPAWVESGALAIARAYLGSDPR